MVGFVVVTHAQVGRELCACVEGILGPQQGLRAVSIDFTKTAEAARAEIDAAIQAVDAGDGIVILADMFGGTPSNIGLSFLDRSDVEVMTGVNLPMLIKGLSFREGNTPAELCEQLEAYGKKGIIVASALLKEQQGQVPYERGGCGP